MSKGAYIQERVPSQFKLGEVGERCPLVRNAIQAYMPVIIALLSSDAHFFQLCTQKSSQYAIDRKEERKTNQHAV